MEGHALVCKGPLQFKHQTSIVIHPKGQVLVSEESSNCIQVLDQDLTSSHSFSSQGPSKGKSQGHHDMAVDSQGIIYIPNIHDHCIQKFSISGQFIEEFGYLDRKEEDVESPLGIAIDDKDYMYVSETNLHRISIFTSKGKFVQCLIFMQLIKMKPHMVKISV